MAARGGDKILRASAGIAAAVLLSIVSTLPAQAGLFERLFGGFRHALRAPQVREFFEPNDHPEQISPDDNGPARAYCVRTCDGQFFPVDAHRGMSVAQACHALCPASPTRIYTGGRIDGAVARDGSRYSDLRNAFVYRQHLVAGCTCNGRDAFGLAHVDVNSDPTLRPGDVVATRKGMMAFTGSKDRTAQFTPADSYPRFSKRYRQDLAAMRIMPTPVPSAAPVKPPSPQASRDTRDRSARR
jgi:Protein of unknown function (DUF2865)